MERTVQANGVDLCTESFGNPADPPILLIMGVSASMLWWDESFCRMLAGGRRFVIRYDNRDTGRSVTYEPGRPRYSGADLLDDALGVLDAYGIAAAHIAGVSAGGAFAQLLALGSPDRVRSLVLISTSPVTPGDRALPPPVDEFVRFLSTARVDWSDPAAAVDYRVSSPQSPPGPWSSTGPRIRCSRSSTAGHWPRPRRGQRRRVSLVMSSSTERSSSSRLACSTDLIPSFRLIQALTSR